jgi:hypothetical protein
MDERFLRLPAFYVAQDQSPVPARLNIVCGLVGSLWVVGQSLYKSV